jgi:hypothetical protein
VWHVCGRKELFMEFWPANMRQRGYLEDLGIDGIKILKKFFKKKDRVIECIDLAHDMESYRAVVNEVITSQAP